VCVRVCASKCILWDLDDAIDSGNETTLEENNV